MHRSLKPDPHDGFKNDVERRREELTKLLVKDFNQERRGVLRVQGKVGKLRYLPAHSLRLVAEYLAASGNGQQLGHGAHARGRVFGGRGALHEAGRHQRREHGPTCASRHSSDFRAGASGRHRQGARVAGAREHQHDARL